MSPALEVHSKLPIGKQAGTFAAENLTRYAQAWSHPRAVTAMLNWYRAAFRYPPKFADLQVHTPTRILWGKNDIALLSEQAQESYEYCAEGELTYFPAATHWLQHEEPEQVNDLLIEFLRRAS